MPSLPFFIEARLHALNSLVLTLHEQLKPDPTLFQWRESQEIPASDPEAYTQYFLNHLTHIPGTQKKSKKAHDCLYGLEFHRASNYRDTSLLWTPAGWKIRKQFSEFVNDYADDLRKNIDIQIEAEADKEPNDRDYDFDVKKSALTYLRARYFVSWQKFLLLSVLSIGFFILFILGLAALAHIGLLGASSGLLVKALISMHVLFVLQTAPATTAFTVIFAFLMLLVFRELVDPGFYMKCFGRKRSIEFHHGGDLLEFKTEFFSTEFFAKQYQFDTKEIAFIRTLLNFRLLPELILKSIKFLLCGFVDFVDSFFITGERSSLVARGFKWGIHLIFCLLATPLYLLKPIEDYPYRGLKFTYKWIASLINKDKGLEKKKSQPKSLTYDQQCEVNQRGVKTLHSSVMGAGNPAGYTRITKNRAEKQPTAVELRMKYGKKSKGTYLSRVT